MSFISEKSKQIPGSMIREMFAMRLLKKKHVVVPGTGFGEALRRSFGDDISSDKGDFGERFSKFRDFLNDIFAISMGGIQAKHVHTRFD